MKILIVYASRETGNSARVAQAIADRLGPECSLFPAAQAPDPEGFDFIALGFGVYRGWPDGDMIAYMKRCRKKKVGLFMTLGAWPDSLPAANCLGRAEGLLADCTVCVKFACQGAYAPAFLARLRSLPPTSSHGWTPERARRITEAMKLAASDALASLPQQDGLNEENILPKPFDPRVRPAVAAAVAAAAGK